jgi:hypothetical protein
MNLDDIWAQLETDLSWRQQEIRLLSNSLSGLTREADRDRARRAQLVMLYAHIEGFSKVALLTYIKAINDERLKSRQLIESLVASSFEDVFHALKYGDIKGKVFSAPLPADEYLHVFCRRRDFIAELENLLNRQAQLPEEVVDTESNLSSKVLRRNLFRLGFPVDMFLNYEENLNVLAYRRHNIAHGVDPSPVASGLYEKLQKAAFQFMDELTLNIVAAIETSRYLRNATEAP